ncbi:MAG: L-glutamate gamma-semialdehyde dehydrogenase [Vicinamibacterales bacterium]
MSSHFSGIRTVLPPRNEPIKAYAPGSPEKASLKNRLAAMAGETIDIPLIIGGREIRTGDRGRAVMPHAHGHVLATWHHARPKDVAAAIAAAQDAKREWSSWPWEDRVAVFLKAAELLATTWRDTLNAATMLNQSKTVFQSEIDAACELVDFWRFNTAFAADLMAEQPVSTQAMWNQSDYRPLEGFVYAVSPFNFTAIGGNLTTTPAMMGNTVVWKPAQTAMVSAYYTMKLLEAAGLPPGVINFVPGDPVLVSDVALNSPDLGGIHFTGSTGVFQHMWEHVGTNIRKYRSYPRLVGETGGKDFIMVHASADPQEVAVAMVRGAFEYQGQKCSAASRVYVPKSLWPDVRERAVAMMREIKMGDPRDFRNFMGAVIDRKAFTKISGYISHARRNAKVVQGGGCNGRVGYFVEPTLVQTDDPGYRLMCEEIFGPVLTAHPYADRKFDEMLQVVDQTSPYALTGSIFARDRAVIRQASAALRNAAGNFYVNDKPTGATVGQQPFGGARASGTNDKAGSKMNLLRWTSARSIKETYDPPKDYTYPFMGEE